MRIVMLVSLLLGMAWNVVAVCLMGGRLADAFRPSFLVAGALAGVAAGLFTVWSRLRRDGKESLLYGVLTYYLGMFAYWASIVVIQRVILCVQHGGLTAFDLRDHLMLILTFSCMARSGSGLFLSR
jgi:hypothetical protein